MTMPTAWTGLHGPPALAAEGVYKRFKIKVAKRRHRLLMTWKHADPKWLRAHLAWLSVKLVTKAFRLDVRFYVALFQALGRLPQALRARRRELAATRVPLETAFEVIHGRPRGS